MINIIGAGPAGLYLAYLLAKENLEVNVFEKNKDIGTPVQCTGITTGHLKNLIKIDKTFLINRCSVVKVYSKKNDTSFKLKDENLILDRKKFDQYLGKLAEKAGANIYLNHKFIRKEANNIIIRNNNKIKKIKASILIGADGPLSKVSKILNPKIKKEFYIGAQARVKIKEDKNTFSCFLGSFSPKFFAWIVPEDNKIARIGLAALKRPNHYLKSFLSLNKIKDKNIIENQGGLIPLYNKNLRIKKDNIYLIGDAATQVKATTGGGIIPSIIAAKALKDDIIKKKDYNKGLKELNKDLVTSLRMRIVLNSMKDDDYNLLIKLCKNKKVKRLIEKYDREFPTRLLTKLLLAEPRFLLFSKLIFNPKVFKRLLFP